MSARPIRFDYQLHRIDAALKEAESWSASKRAAMRTMIEALTRERAEVIRSHSRSTTASRRDQGLARAALPLAG